VKWHESPDMDTSVIVSSRVRLARNIKKYPFAIKLLPQTAESMISEAIQAAQKAGPLFSEIEINNKTAIEKSALINSHVISPEFLKGNKPRRLLLTEDETISVMVNEEDHLRMQAIFSGDNMDKAWDMADKTDNLFEESLEYAFHKDFGYLTSCPTNTGTGMRASYMLHIPILESAGQVQAIVSSIGKAGMVVRGIYGEGTGPKGSMYQISNQVTTGKSEQEIIGLLKSVTSQIIDMELQLREKLMAEQRIEIEDMTNRAYGILTNCRKITGDEALSLLSQVRIGLMMSLIQGVQPKRSIYNIMINMQPGVLQLNYGREMSESERDICRARFIREALQ